MTVEVGKLRVLELLVEFGRPDLIEKFQILPFAARGRALGIRDPSLVTLLRAGIVLLGRIHELAIGLVVPPDEAQIGRQHIRSRMYVAGDALAGRNGSCELMLYGMPGLVFRNGGIDLRAMSLVAEGRVRTGMHRRAIVSVDHVARGAAAVPIVARMVVGAGHGENRIQETGLLQAKKHRVGAKLGTESTLAQLHIGTAGFLFRI